MLIVHSIPSLGESGGGPPRSVGQICGALCDHVPVALVTALAAGDPQVELDPRVRLKCVTADLRGLKGRLSSPDFGVLLGESVGSENEEIVVHQHGIWLQSSHQTTRFAVRRRYPLVVSPRGMLEPWALNNSKWKKRVAWRLFQRRDLALATGFHATAASEAESIRRQGLKQPIAVIPNGIVLPDLAGSWERGAGSGESEALRVPSTLPQSTKTALFLSRINPKKGLPMLLDAWAKVAPHDWRLVIAGNDDSNHLPVVGRKIRELGLEDRVTVVGPLFGEEKEDAYRNADLFVLPSYSENFGIVVTEALGYRLPVLTTKGCPWQELETDGCGWWVEPTLEGVEHGLREALGAGSRELAAMGIRGRKLVEEKYQWPGIAERMMEFYQWLLNGGKQPEFVV